MDPVWSKSHEETYPHPNGDHYGRNSPDDRTRSTGDSRLEAHDEAHGRHQDDDWHWARGDSDDSVGLG